MKTREKHRLTTKSWPRLGFLKGHESSGLYTLLNEIIFISKSLASLPIITWKTFSFCLFDIQLWGSYLYWSVNRNNSIFFTSLVIQPVHLGTLHFSPRISPLNKLCVDYGHSFGDVIPLLLKVSHSLSLIRNLCPSQICGLINFEYCLKFACT